MADPQLTWNPDESRQALEVAIAIDAAAKDATRRERARCTEHVEALLLIAFEGRVSLADVDKTRAAIRSGEPAPEGK